MSDEERKPQTIFEKYPGDAEAQVRAALWYANAIRADRMQADAEAVSIKAEITALEERAHALRKDLDKVQQAHEERTAHDRRVLATWLRQTAYLNGRRKSFQLGEHTIGECRKKGTVSIAVPDETLAELFPDLTVPKLADKREAKKRLAVEPVTKVETTVNEETGEVTVTRTVTHTVRVGADGPVVEDAVVTVIEPQVQRYIKIGGATIELERVPVEEGESDEPIDDEPKEDDTDA